MYLFISLWKCLLGYVLPVHVAVSIFSIPGRRYYCSAHSDRNRFPTRRTREYHNLARRVKPLVLFRYCVQRYSFLFLFWESILSPLSFLIITAITITCITHWEEIFFWFYFWLSGLWFKDANQLLNVVKSLHCNDRLRKTMISFSFFIIYRCGGCCTRIQLHIY